MTDEEVVRQPEYSAALYVKPAADVGSPAKDIADKITEAMVWATPGQWVSTTGKLPRVQWAEDRAITIAGVHKIGRQDEPAFSNTVYIALCNPDNMRVLLSALADAERERDELQKSVESHLKWFERFICNVDELNSSTPRKVAQNAQDAAAELRAALASMKGGEQNG